MKQQNLLSILWAPFIHSQRSIRGRDIPCSKLRVWGVWQVLYFSSGKRREDRFSGRWKDTRLTLRGGDALNDKIKSCARGGKKCSLQSKRPVVPYRLAQQVYQGSHR